MCTYYIANFLQYWPALTLGIGIVATSVDKRKHMLNKVMVYVLTGSLPSITSSHSFMSPRLIVCMKYFLVMFPALGRDDIVKCYNVPCTTLHTLHSQMHECPCARTHTHTQKRSYFYTDMHAQSSRVHNHFHFNTKLSFNFINFTPYTLFNLQLIKLWLSREIEF